MLVDTESGSIKVVLTTLVAVVSVVEDNAEQYPVMYDRVVAVAFPEAMVGEGVVVEVACRLARTFGAGMRPTQRLATARFIAVCEAAATQLEVYIVFILIREVFVSVLWLTVRVKIEVDVVLAMTVFVPLEIVTVEVTAGATVAACCVMVDVVARGFLVLEELALRLKDSLVVDGTVTVLVTVAAV